MILLYKIMTAYKFLYLLLILKIQFNVDFKPQLQIHLSNLFRGEKKDENEPFRKWCGLVGEIRSFLPKQVPFLALTATASSSTRNKIIKSLSLNRCLEITVSPNRKQY